MKKIHIIGGGLAGPEAALQAASLGCQVILSEMRPLRSTEAHQTSDFAELVCSNSLKSESENSAPWLLKQEMRRANSFLLQAADATSVPAGHALAVDRALFSERVAALIVQHPNIEVRREEITHLNENDPNTITILASGPLTSSPLAQELQRLTGTEQLAFYDSISPIVDAATIDMDKVYFAARWDKGTADYINCPFTKPEYEAFIDALAAAEKIQHKSWEQIPTAEHPATDVSSRPERSEVERPASGPVTATTKPPQYFEGCLPIEEIARRGRDTLRFGPMKPAGLTDPKTGRWPYACVQLRQETLRADSYNLVGFQNSLKYGEQARILRMIPGLENATFLRYGQVHRNTYIHAPSLLTETLQLKQHLSILIAGQLSGVEGYTESIASGLLAGRYAAALARGEQPTPAPRLTANGSLTHYITHAETKHFQPANITFDLLVPLEEDLRKKIRDKKERHRIQCERALEAWDTWLNDSRL
ncbi:methylenetetrahydrofolate--tRNA-(uracil(54)-C(5))-methyltransferase (FADH(2)-oxidizing) TrmFO [Granulicella sp. 5B5]|uniref:methylenetetrahydrofolate--tRNA-(uracil(54)- C(5))-methyltransferase (FADH(2)-oxidizing) TrmFO n=1 Tax=Granulicella sp. 5B5 TaxID=1617967 RepID=UPI0015F619B2|nr:methylenetetrahydrofolate--tRNA-(uracil(54)-C(5))-methyltransferase (FADH(2)-oxidizing) TrmFO [Granulicella sp. 5B5]QMV19295.1 methylenetetrahydrofolate--tRNA-(uracil(54)-C(5))-methyltransferase (FADH(2)-oxidizing) TrmFO [Granulicella sp. 5B5]